MAKKRDFDVRLNFVPFIDLLSSITVFLLITAVWHEYAQIDVEPQGLGRDAEDALDEDEPVTASILISEGATWAGLSTGDVREIPRSTDEAGPWQEELQEVLSEFNDMEVFDDRYDIEVAAENQVPYQTVISTMDTAILAGFNDVGFVDPPSLTVQFHE